MESQPEPIPRLTIPLLPNIAFAICLAGILITGLAGWVYDYIYSLSIQL
jgi:NADH-quinone oxidoreductase subunit N